MLSRTTSGGLIGRDSEYETLRRLIEDLACGRGGLVLIEGEPGIGKSALLQSALSELDPGYLVFWGAGDELGQALPLLPLLEALRVREPSDNPRQHMIVGLLRGETAADRGMDVSAALAEQLLALIAEQCAARPAILVIDDLQWADRASVALWARLAKTVRQMRLLLIATMRPVPQREDLLALRRSVGAAQRMRLTGLSQPAVAELVAAVVGGRPGERLLRLADDAAGNPLYVTELLAALARGSSLTVTGANVELADGQAPGSLSAAIADRLGFVSGPVRLVLRAAALLGVDFAVPDLAIVLGRGVTDLVASIDEACAAGVLVDSGGGLGFRHPVIRAALYDEMPAPVRAAWHRDAAHALADAGAPADRVARQLLWAADGSGDSLRPMDEWMLGWLAESAQFLVGQAPQVAVGLLRWALASSRVGVEQHCRLAGLLAEALYRVGDVAEAEQVTKSALELAVEPDLQVDLLWTQVQCRMLAGQSAESLASLDRALATPGISDRHRTRLLALSARTHSSLGAVETAGRVAASAIEAASRTGDDWAMGWALHVLTIVTAVQGRMADALPLFDRALAVTQADPALTDLRLLLQINKAATLGNLDRYEEAFAAARQAQSLAEQAGTLVRLAQAHCALGELLFDTGRWSEAMSEVLALPEELKEPAAACCDHGIAAAICFHRGDAVLARRHLASALPHYERIGNRMVAPLALARSLDREHADARREALAVLTAGFAVETEELEEVEDLLPDATRLAAVIGDTDTAKVLAGRTAALAADSQIPTRQANALYCRGLVDGDASLLLRAAEHYRAAGRPLMTAKALEAAAEAFVTADDHRQARAAFTVAVELYSSLGAASDVARLQARFRVHGIRRGPRARHTRARSGWDSLTPTEIKVAGLVEEGLSNPAIAARLFLSQRTVATHVSHILKKLDVHSRIDIARESALRSISSK